MLCQPQIRGGGNLLRQPRAIVKRPEGNDEDLGEPDSKIHGFQSSILDWFNAYLIRGQDLNFFLSFVKVSP